MRRLRLSVISFCATHSRGGIFGNTIAQPDRAQSATRLATQSTAHSATHSASTLPKQSVMQWATHSAAQLPNQSVLSHVVIFRSHPISHGHTTYNFIAWYIIRPLFSTPVNFNQNDFKIRVHIVLHIELIFDIKEEYPEMNELFHCNVWIIKK